MTTSATGIVVPVCSKAPLLYLLTQKAAQKFGYVLGIKKGKNMQQTYRYRNIIIKPHWMQFVINELHLLVLISVGFVYAGIDDAVLSTLVFVL